MKTIEAYQTSDGQLFTSESKAKEHQDDLLGQELDGLLKLFNLDITRTQEYKSLFQLMKRRKELHQQIKLISQILDFEEHGRN